MVLVLSSETSCTDPRIPKSSPSTVTTALLMYKHIILIHTLRARSYDRPGIHNLTGHLQDRSPKADHASACPKVLTLVFVMYAMRAYLL